MVFHPIKTSVAKRVYVGITLSAVAIFLGCPSAWSGNFDEENKASSIMKTVAAKLADLPVPDGISSDALAFSPDGTQLAVRSTGNAIDIWDWRKQTIIKKLALPTGANDSGASKSLQFSPKGNILASCHTSGSSFASVTLWNTRTWRVSGSVGERQAGHRCNAIDFTPDGNFLIVVLHLPQDVPGNNIEVYDTDKWDLVNGIRTNPFTPSVLALSPKGDKLAVGGHLIPLGDADVKGNANPFNHAGHIGESLIAIVDRSSLNVNALYPSGIDVSSFSRLAWSADDSWVTHAGGHGLERFNPSTGERSIIAPPTVERAEVDIRYTPDGKYFVDAHGDKVAELRLWDHDINQKFYTIYGKFTAIDVSRDGRYLSAATPGKITVWEIKQIQ